ncbi:phosphotransferase family protein [Herbidospora yilanensis]|uniref:phosphotransferase family protein n=1 Tax=Herbidospora yilanensis TaxID=354426 RepID=UPI000A074A62|nr:aminoglycoside phosphotransferase family protein [Herbidospora yilanensis]
MRQVSAVVTCGDTVHGRFGPVEMPSPWWNDAAPVVAWLSGLLGVPVVVLRLIDVEGGARMRDGHVTYHAEALEQPPHPSTPALQAETGSPEAGMREGLAAAGVPAPSDEEPLRASWATREGLRAALDWALAVTGPSEIRQVKTWNLAGLFHLPGGDAWLKTTPPFAAREPSVIAALAQADPTLVPKVLGADPDRGWMLLEHIPGEDCWQAGPDLVAKTVRRFARAQQTVGAPAARPWTVGPREAIGERGLPAAVPGSPPPGLVDRRSMIAATGRLPRVPGSAELLAEVPALEEELAACGIPYTLVHGDFHPGNWRAVPGGPAVVLDFADAHFGHPAADGLRLQEWTGDAEAWVGAWSLPGADPRRALEVAAPLAALGRAVRYQEFLDGIEPSERRYHAGDPEEALVDAVRALRRLRRA